MASSTTPSNNFAALRLIAALLVLYSHMFAVVGRPEPAIFSALLPGITLGGFAVLVFFSLSGFLITQSWQHDPHPGRFLARRFLRIWPGLATATLLGAFILAPCITQQSLLQLLHNHQYLSYLKNLTLTPIYHTFDAFTSLPIKSLNAPPWTIPLEFCCYLLLLLLTLAQPRALFVTMPVFLALMLTIFTLNGGQTGLNQLHHSPWLYLAEYSLFFATGSLLYLYPKLQQPTAIVISLIIGITCLAIGQTYLGCLLLIPALVIATGTATWPIFYRVGRYGDFSYGLYLYAWPVQQTVTLTLGPTAPFSLLLGATIFFTGICAVLSWWLIEAPSLHLKTYLQKNPTGQGPLNLKG